MATYQEQLNALVQRQQSQKIDFEKQQQAEMEQAVRNGISGDEKVALERRQQQETAQLVSQQQAEKIAFEKSYQTSPMPTSPDGETKAEMEQRLQRELNRLVQKQQSEKIALEKQQEAERDAAAKKGVSQSEKIAMERRQQEVMNALVTRQQNEKIALEKRQEAERNGENTSLGNTSTVLGSEASTLSPFGRISNAVSSSANANLLVGSALTVLVLLAAMVAVLRRKLLKK